MEVEFKTKELLEWYLTGKESGKQRFPVGLVKRFREKIDFIRSAGNSKDLALYRSLHFESLNIEKKYKGMHSIRVNDQFRIILRIIRKKDVETVEVAEILELIDYH